MPESLLRLLPEEKLLISLCRIGFSDEQKSEIRDLLKEVKDWDRFMDLANKNGVIALCRHNLTETGFINNIPSGYKEKLHSAYLKNLARTTFLFSQFEGIVNLANDEDIKIIALKGTALEKTVYGNRGLRQMTDLDILVRQVDAIKLRKILLKNGFESAPVISPLFEKKVFQHGKHLPEMYRNGISVELHFRLFEDKDNSLTEELYSRAYRLKDESNIFFPEPLTFFLYLLKHLDEHEREGTSQLRLYTDLAVLLTHYPGTILTRELTEKAGRANLEKALNEKLYLLVKFWGIRLPEWIRSDTQNPGQVSDPEQQFMRFIRSAGENEPHAKVQGLFKPLNEIGGIFNKILFLTGYIFPSLSYMKYKYNAKTRLGAILYYPVRWGRLMKRFKV